jgi:catechol 2,3-dioxygenase-like lactoylglutathione lyase family enzyme
MGLPGLIRATNHTSFTVSDVERSLPFWRDVIGLELISLAPRDPALIERIVGVPGAEVLIAYLTGHGHTLELIEYTAPAAREHVRPRPCDVGFAHIAYDVGDLDAALEACAAHGVLPIAPPAMVDKGPNAGMRVSYLRDPDGITIELIEKPA